MDMYDLERKMRVFIFLYELAIDPLGLPIDVLYEYIILAVLGYIAYLYAFEKTGSLIARRAVMDKHEACLMHWTIRFIFFIAVWLIIRGVIWIQGFVLEYRTVSIISLACILSLIAVIKIFNYLNNTRDAL